MKKVLVTLLVVVLASCSSSVKEVEIPAVDSTLIQVDTTPVKVDTLKVSTCNADTTKK